MARKSVTWILIADSVHARIYGNDGPRLGIYRATEEDLKIDLPHKVGDIMSDREGRMVNPGRHGPQTRGPRTDPRQHLEEEFLRTVAVELEHAAEAKLFDRLILVSPPKALGMLRASLGKHAKALVTKELDKDLVQLPERELERHLLDAGAIA
jgi:protein required for attachment to host cells